MHQFGFSLNDYDSLHPLFLLITIRSELEKTTHAAELEGKQQELEIQEATIAKYETEVQHLKSQVRYADIY